MSDIAPVFCGDCLPKLFECVLLDDGNRYCVGYLRPDGKFYVEQDGLQFFAQYWQPLPPRSPDST